MDTPRDVPHQSPTACCLPSAHDSTWDTAGGDSGATPTYPHQRRASEGHSPKLSLWLRVMALLTAVRRKFHFSWKLAASLINSSLLLLGYYFWGRKKGKMAFMIKIKEKKHVFKSAYLS